MIYEQFNLNGCLYIYSLCIGKQPKPLMTQQPDVDKVYTGESVSFECTVELSSGWAAYQWYKDGTQLPINTSSFNIRDSNLTNGGTFDCVAIRDKTMYNTQHSDGRILRVSGEPKKMTLCWGVFQVYQTIRKKLKKKKLMCLFLFRNSCSIFEVDHTVV